MVKTVIVRDVVFWVWRIAGAPWSSPSDDMLRFWFVGLAQSKLAALPALSDGPKQNREIDIDIRHRNGPYGDIYQSKHQ